MGACLSGGNLSVPKVGASELINQCSFIHSGVHVPLASELIHQCSFIHSGAHAPLASALIDQCLCIHSGAHAPLASVLIHQCSFIHSGVHAPRGYLCQILCWDMERSGPTVEELPSQREDRITPSPSSRRALQCVSLPPNRITSPSFPAQIVATAS